MAHRAPSQLALDPYTLMTSDVLVMRTLYSHAPLILHPIVSILRMLESDVCQDVSSIQYHYDYNLTFVSF